ncbi:hypothetical protein IPJ72_02425 [Candidatus Peregrinibacteria bacterium]|nr:MAG: hypothetical protein IPJ72_02425 [Candidatus Peregrinibacteria bacterium]
MKKIMLILLFGLALSLTTGCTQNGKVNELESESLNSIPVKMPTFERSANWQVLSMSDIDLIEPYKEAVANSFETNILGYRSTEINFDQPHNLGPYGRTVDVQIQDIIFETPPETPEDYLTKLENAWGQKGQKEAYTAASGLHLVQWLGQSPAYEAKLVLYVTRYTDDAGQNHFVEISRMGTEYEAIQSSLKPIVNSLKF